MLSKDFLQGSDFPRNREYGNHTELLVSEKNKILIEIGKKHKFMEMVIIQTVLLDLCGAPRGSGGEVNTIISFHLLGQRKPSC